MNLIKTTALYKRGLFVLLCLVFAHESEAQRRVGLSLANNRLNVLAIEYEDAPRGTELGLNIMRWRADNKFVTTNIAYYASNQTGTKEIFNNNTGKYEPASYKDKHRAFRLEFIYSKLLSPAMEMDDDLIFYRNLGFGLELVRGTREVTYTNPNLGTEETYPELSSEGLGNSILFGLGFQKNLPEKLSISVDLNIIITSTVLAAIQPKVGLYYRLY